jgi:hypothetical protein
VVPLPEIVQIKQQAVLGLIPNAIVLSLKNGIEV